MADQGAGRSGGARARAAKVAEPPADAARPTFERYAGFEAIPVAIAIRVGAATCTVERLRHLADGDLVLLDRPVGSPFDLLSGDLLLGQVEPVAVDSGVAVKLVSVAEDGDGSSD